MEPSAPKDRLTIFYRRISRTTWFRLLRWVMILFFLGLIAYAIANLNIFYVQRFEVEGFAGEDLENIRTEDVENHLKDYYGKRLFLINTDSIVSSLIDNFPFIDKVYVTKHIPDTLKVRIRERTPILVLGPVDLKALFPVSASLIFHQSVLIDETRMVLAGCDSADEIGSDTSDSTQNERLSLCQDFPVCLFLESPDSYSPGDTVFFAELDEVIEFDQILSDSGVHPTGYAVPEKDTIVITLEDATRAIFTLEQPLEDQVRSFEYTRENLSLEGKSYMELDFRYDRPVMRVDKYTTWMTE